MKKQEKAKAIQKILQKCFPNPQIPLHHTNNFTFLVAVILSAQCTDERVNRITPSLFKLADTPEKMILLHVTDIERIIRPCGLSNAKSKAIWNLSRILIDNYKGKVPSAFEDLLSLPGVGRKTASVIYTQAFHKPAFPVDTHIDRCAHRWGLSTAKTVRKTEEDLKKLFPEKSWSKLHLQIIYFARKYCPARGHVIEKCPICSFLKKESS